MPNPLQKLHTRRRMRHRSHFANTVRVEYSYRTFLWRRVGIDGVVTRHDTTYDMPGGGISIYTSHKVILYIYIYIYISERKERFINLLFYRIASHRTAPYATGTVHDEETLLPSIHPPTKISLLICLLCNTMPCHAMHCTVTYRPTDRCGGKNEANLQCTARHSTAPRNRVIDSVTIFLHQRCV